MTDDENGEDGPVPRSSGYRKPPKEHQFRPGKSGNPAGRPKAASKQTSPTIKSSAQPGIDIILRELNRKVTVNIGGNRCKIPVFEAALRGLTINALKGNRRAQKDVVELNMMMEKKKRDEAAADMISALKYKRFAEDVIAAAKEAGEPDPRLVPHPEDICIDPRSGEVTYLGPLNEAERDTYDRLIKRRGAAQEEVLYYAERYRKARSAAMKAMWLENWLREQKRFDRINDIMLGRYKAVLQSRWYDVSGLG